MAVIDGMSINGNAYDLRDKVAVRFNEAQSLTDAQKAIGRGNIDAAGAAAVAALGGRVTDAEADINVLEAGKVEIADMVSRYAGRKMSFLGDSISTFNAEGYKIDGYNMYYPSGDVTSVEDTWFKQVLDGSGTVIEVNASWSGSRVTNTHPNASYPDFYQRCGLLGNPDVIFVALGTNDSSNNIALGDYDFETVTASLSEATFRTAYIKGVKALQANYPNAEIVLLIMSMGDGYADSIRHIGAGLGAQVVDCRGYQGSGVHPGAAGMRWIASRVLYPVDGGLTVAGMAADAAAVGAALAARDEAMSEALAGKVAVQQGSGNAGKALVVGGDGAVTIGDAGIPDAVKVSLLDLVRHVAYIDNQGQAYYDALYAALYNEEPPTPVEVWDFEWDSSSGVLPDGMTATRYDFTTEPGVLHIETPVLDLNYVGNCKLQIEMKAVPGDGNNNPQILIKNAIVDTNQFRGIKLIMSTSLSTSSEHRMSAVSVNGVNSLIPGSNSEEYHKYELTAENNVYGITIDDVAVAITQNTNTSPYYARTGITTSNGYWAFIKSIKFKRL